MPILNKEESKQILEKVIGFSKADSIEASLDGYVGGNIRYARNTVSTSGTESKLDLSVSSSFGKKSGTATINEFDDASLEKVVRRSEELAKFSPENPEFMEPLGPQEYDDMIAYSKNTASITPEQRTIVAEQSINAAKAKGVTAAGFLEDGEWSNAMMNSNGLFVYSQDTEMDFTITMRTEDGTGSGYAIRNYTDFNKFSSAKSSDIAIDKAITSQNAKAIEPGKYTVILEPAASFGLLRNMMWNMSARRADEGRSFLSKKGGGTKKGEQIVDERVNIYSDPLNAEAPGMTWVGNGLPMKKTSWIKNGVVDNIRYGRFWAKEKGVDPLPYRGNFIMEGGNSNLDEMIKNTKRGILVTRLWYIRSVDPQTLLYTGLTRDGTFFIENGKIKHPVKNFRFNESPIIMLNNLETLGEQVRIGGSLVPIMKVRDFTFSSLSDAI